MRGLHGTAVSELWRCEPTLRRSRAGHRPPQLPAAASPLAAIALPPCRSGKYGGPATLPCGHNGCLACLRSVQATRPSEPLCPLCRAPFPAQLPLAINTELRDLVTLAIALTSNELGGEDAGWQAVTSEARRRHSGGWAPDGGDGGGLLLAPSMPPPPGLRIDVAAVLNNGADVLSLEPPAAWLPDSAAAACMSPACGKPFSFLVRSRHHCRACGRIFCGACTAFLLLPPRFHCPEPQRVCGACAELLMPVQVGQQGRAGVQRGVASGAGRCVCGWVGGGGGGGDE